MAQSLTCRHLLRSLDNMKAAKFPSKENILTFSVQQCIFKYVTYGL